MKKNLLVLLTTSLILALHIDAQDVIPNGNFELWDGGPVNWVDPIATTDFQNVFQSNDAQSGASSVRFEMLFDDNSGTYLPAGLNSVPFTITESHTSINGFYKGTSVESDFLTINAVFFKNGEALGTGNFIAMESAADWTPFSIQLDFQGTQIPNEAFIYIAVGGSTGTGHEGTVFLVDNLQFDQPAGIFNRKLVTRCNVLPNPARDFTNINFTLPTSDRLYFNLISTSGWVTSIPAKDHWPSGENTLRIDTHRLSSGIYFLQAVGEFSTFTGKFVVKK